jgi:hypothetical protein
MVVTEMKTPIRALARASVNETTPTIPADPDQNLVCCHAGLR